MPDGQWSRNEPRREAEYASSGARFWAGFWDVLFAAALATCLYLLMHLYPMMFDIWGWVFFFLVFGIIHLVLAGLFETFRQRTIGKYIEGIEVYSLTGEPVTFGQAIGRNVSKIFFIVYLIDILAGMGKEPTQKASDASLNTVLIKTTPTVLRRPRKRKATTKAEEDLTDDQEAKRLRMIEYLRHGRCSKCGAPFRILEKGDTSFSGLWMSRCTWCNKKVFDEDDAKTHIQPGFVPVAEPKGYHGFKDWERETYLDWERKKVGGGPPEIKP